MPADIVPGIGETVVPTNDSGLLEKLRQLVEEQP